MAVEEVAAAPQEKRDFVICAANLAADEKDRANTKGKYRRTIGQGAMPGCTPKPCG